MAPKLKLVATATVIAVCSTVDYHTKVASFQTPLLWMGKSLKKRHRIGEPFPPMSTLATLKSFVAIRVGQKKNESTEKLVEWLEDGRGFSSSVTVDTNSQGLRGLYAKNDIMSGRIIVEVPYNSALLIGDTTWVNEVDDFGDVRGSNGWSKDDVDDVYQGLHFLRNFVENCEYYAPYVDNLPQIPSSGDEVGLTPDFWSSDIIAGLEVQALVKQIRRRKQIVEEVAKENDVNENELRWATFMVRSRRFTTWNMIDDPSSKKDGTFFGVFPILRNKIEQRQGFLLPLIDMANHAHNPNAGLKISVNRITRDFDDTSSFALRALRPIKKGEEVTISYGEGDGTSLDLLDKYGFFTVENEADKKIDWVKLNPKFTNSLEDDEAELARLEKLSHEDNIDVFMDSDSVSPSLVEDCLQSNREMEQRAEVTSATANMPEEKNPGSRRTMLSLRILMKRLSK